MPPHRPLPWLAASALIAFFIAALPLLTWYARRVGDGSDEPLGVIALVAALVALGTAAGLGQRDRVQLRPVPMLAGSCLLALAQFGPWGVPPLLAGLLAVAVVAASLRMPRGKAGVVALLVLSLPLVASLDFFAGYPLRLAIAEIAGGLLGLGGLAVERAGVMLVDGDRIVGIDPPCAGIRMLWSACFVAAVLAARLRLGWTRTLALTGLAVGVVILGNGLRAAIVFFPESGRVEWPEWAHPAIGLVVHAGVLLAVFGLAERLGRLKRPPENSRPWVLGRRAAVVTLALLATAGGVTIVSRGAPAPTADPGDWPATLHGVALTPLPLSPVETRFAAAFPGSIARFAWGDAEVILRRTDRPTRRMHPAAHCLRAAGFQSHAEPAFRDADGLLWGSSTARRDGRRWQIYERYTSANGDAFTDASTWYWQALLHPRRGPWTAITVIRPAATSTVPLRG